MDDLSDIKSEDEKALANDLDGCAFEYGGEFVKIAEHPREVAAANYYATINSEKETENTEELNAEPFSEEKKESGRTRVHIDLGGDKTKEKLSPQPSDKNKQISVDKKTKK